MAKKVMLKHYERYVDWAITKERKPIKDQHLYKYKYTNENNYPCTA